MVILGGRQQSVGPRRPPDPHIFDLELDRTKPMPPKSAVLLAWYEGFRGYADKGSTTSTTCWQAEFSIFFAAFAMQHDMATTNG